MRMVYPGSWMLINSAAIIPASTPGNQTRNLVQSSSHIPSGSSAETQSHKVTVPSLVSTSFVGCSRSIPATVLLQTAIVKTFDSYENIHWARALLDPASQLSLITENLAQKLQLRRQFCHQEIGGVGNSVVVSNHAVIVQLGSHCSDFVSEARCHILKRITRELPIRCLTSSLWKIPAGIVLADPQFHKPSAIDLLIGMEMYYDLLLEGFMKLGPEKPILQKTVFGWVASGKVGMIQSPTPMVAHITHFESLDDQIRHFWDIESCWLNSTNSLEETACENNFAATISRDHSGRYVVTLPKRASLINQLGNSKQIAMRRFSALERRLDGNPEQKSAYSEFINEYYRLKHMREIDDDEPSPNFKTYYLPHHGVEKVDSTTTKLRVVFDASCKTDSGISLNQALMVGPVVQDDLLAIILRFRMHRFV
ncbi:uncharacterized protein LOC129729293 [Wyeomyia smithii]|uniref:uncharacterized protein LOC129729293 n=1 Tax=Wyeomyia smithii TaxID=174621 RepID=UPI002467FB05|nr:uncharacterized protein LOC129729293 [Wyeomyia smithii]